MDLLMGSGAAAGRSPLFAAPVGWVWFFKRLCNRKSNIRFDVDLAQCRGRKTGKRKAWSSNPHGNVVSTCVLFFSHILEELSLSGPPCGRRRGGGPQPPLEVVNKNSFLWTTLWAMAHAQFRVIQDNPLIIVWTTAGLKGMS